ncbi:hypothetical protein ACOMHN_007262 [Nucella lapillus]
MNHVTKNNNKLCEEKKFFHKVSSRLSKPNIFVLQNRWDVSEMEEDIDKVKQQHIDYNTQFLADELQVLDKKEAKDRVFFVSALEALVSRLHNDTGILPTPDRVLLPGFQASIFEFDNFENKFEVVVVMMIMMMMMVVVGGDDDDDDSAS